jgi:hypothetical protein
MCDTQTLAYTPEGYIVRCPECKRMQMVFGAVAVVVKERQLRQLRERGQLELLYRSSFLAEPEIRCISLSINSVTMLFLSFNELQSLMDLLDQAYALLEVYSLLNA